MERFCFRAACKTRPCNAQHNPGVLTETHQRFGSTTSHGHDALVQGDLKAAGIMFREVLDIMEREGTSPEGQAEALNSLANALQQQVRACARHAELRVWHLL